jgi:hypothetical protein
MSQVIPARFEARFHENLSYLRSSHPALYQNLSKRRMEIGLKQTGDGRLNLTLEGRYLESPHGYEKQSDGDPGVTEGPVIYLGSGLGYRINRLQAAAGGESVLIERDPEVFRAALYVLEPAVLRTLVLYVDTDTQVLAREVPRLLSGRRARIVQHRRSVQLHRQYYDEVLTLITDALKSILASDVTARASRRLWLKNVLRNLTSLGRGCFGSRSLSSAFSGPAILVASGPFLEDIVDDLRRWARLVPLFSLLPSVPYLQHNGITPDFVVTTDAGFWNRYRVCRGCSLPLITTYSAEPVLVENWEGPRLFFSHGLPIERLIPPIHRLSLVVPMQGTASIVMVLIARAMGFTDLYLAGFDFAFLGMKDHHRGAGFEALLSSVVHRFAPLPTVLTQRMRSEGMRLVEDCGRVTIPTSHKLLLYRNWFEREVDLRGLKRLNNGAVLRGVPTARREDLERRGPEIRVSFKKAMEHLVLDPLERGVAEESLETLKRLFAKREEAASREIRDMFIGSNGEPTDGNALLSDLDFIAQELERMQRRRSCL